MFLEVNNHCFGKVIKKNALNKMLNHNLHSDQKKAKNRVNGLWQKCECKLIGEEIAAYSFIIILFTLWDIPVNNS